MEKKEFSTSRGEYHILDSVSICPSNETTSGSTAVIGVTTWLSFL